LRALLAQAGAPLCEGADAEAKLTELRLLYEPYVYALSHQLLMELPPWLPGDDEVDAWRSSPWEFAPQSVQSVQVSQLRSLEYDAY
jgi:hypothetical protein